MKLATMSNRFHSLSLSTLLFGIIGLASPLLADKKAEESVPKSETEWQHVELRRFPASEAGQGVAVDDLHFYAINNREIGKYLKSTGERVAGWKGEKDGPFRHLNSGIVVDGKLIAAHSNFPKMPEESSIEIWDTKTMKHLESHKLEYSPGSLTWAFPDGDGWLACFAHYRKTTDPHLTRVVRFDRDWKPLASWAFPTDLIDGFGGASSSGGAIGPEGNLFVSGHDAQELYLIKFPESTEEPLIWETTVPMSGAGQAFAWDPNEEGVLYSIFRKTHEVIVSRITKK